MNQLAEYTTVMQILRSALPAHERGMTALMGLWIVMSILFCLGLTLSLAGLYVWLNARYLQEIALLGVGGVLIAISLLLVCVTIFFIHRAQQPLRRMANKLTHNSGELIKSLFDELDDPIRENPLAAMIIAVLGGYIASEKVMR
jgi:hypothetical protein